ncbi:ABC transporter ATP-binding protein [Marmoricola endophyticus]|uniref:ABC transporter ATP-binding protein n=1 Tax=Marmoricola endophyticus TaxID=2040280 RepID=A0A917BL20_9ACTN|nr:ATP-binding cassette domain-containing protein [Marmoricola endophyticus]GGF47578.1 ABC transporter ATP-binding protein [Marmoricola endophyticus]
MSVLRADGLTVAYEHFTLSPVDLALDAGTFLAVTGPSGAGKTTLLWALAGAVPLSDGYVSVDGRTLADRSAAARAGVVVVPQGNALVTSLTAHENVLVPVLSAAVPPPEAADRTIAALERVGLEDVGRQLPEELSGGQQQRVAVARVLAARGAVVLADEPTSDLDAGNREQVIAALRAEADRGAVVVMATHDPVAAERTDGELALHEGRSRWERALGPPPSGGGAHWEP